MAIEGNLKDVGFADICQLLAMGRKTGCLSVTDRSNFGYVYFEQGWVVYASVLNRRDRLGDVLVGAGKLTRDELAKAMQVQSKNPRKRLGQILVEQERITEEELQARVSIQIQEAVFHLFGWESGDFSFEPDRRPDEKESMLVSLNAESLLLEGARRLDEWSQIERHVSSMDLIFHVARMPGDGEEGSDLTEEQATVLALVDGERTVDDIAIASGLVEFETAKAVFGLAQAGFISTEGEQRASEEGDDDVSGRELEKADAFYRAGMLEDAAKLYASVLEGDDANPRARSRLALIAIRSGDPETALEHLDAAPKKHRKEPASLRNRAVALERLGRVDEALAAIDRATEAAPDEPGVLLTRAILLLKAGRPGDAMSGFRRYRQACGAGKNPPAIYFAYAILAAAAGGDSAQAMRVGREGLTLYPSSSPILVNFGAVLEGKGETDAAEALFLRAVQRSPPPPQAHKNLGDLAYRRGDQAGAEAHYVRALRLDPSLGDETYLRLGEMAYKDGDTDTARERWERAVELNPRNEVARSNLAMVGRSDS